ncbi:MULTISPECIES: histone-like nucleoid-structuring protein Lsr2 [Rhodococcus]|jgi:hypothetical protein|uniref:Lsr2 family DNA-binding protein n=1 Tax=Nocardiaceae TaxID=85025 RepID=UPI00050CB73A|nr:MULTISPECIES: histone-like nucleoid-structuring protein Lsr2 [Rhodococcus]KQU35777.1 hypothetical protein ASH04_24190 [Rhodococcus sp. Leaf233]MBP2527390.1 hypothetical protein [Rhodococcus sp. PvP104]WQH31141.1 histone-like nucleoid-structuring protein Lsr2 [Rhodococcus fascians]
MTIKESTTVYSDATGEVVENWYRVGVVFDNAIWVVDVDRDKLEDELKAITVYDVVKKGRRVKKVGRNAHGSLNAAMHHEARLWAKANGIDVGDRGMVSKEIITKYHEAKGIGPISLLDPAHSE